MMCTHILGDRRCDFCGKFSVTSKRCGRCLDAQYCSLDCQKQDWKTHKTSCDDASKAECSICFEVGREKRIRTGCTCKPDGVYLRAHASCIVEIARVKEEMGGIMHDWSVCTTCRRPFSGEMKTHLIQEWKNHFMRKQMIVMPVEITWLYDSTSRHDSNGEAISLYDKLKKADLMGGTTQLVMSCVVLYQLSMNVMATGKCEEILATCIKNHSKKIEFELALVEASMETSTEPLTENESKIIFLNVLRVAMFMADAIVDIWTRDKTRVAGIITNMRRVLDKISAEKPTVEDMVRQNALTINIYTLEAMIGLREKAISGLTDLLASITAAGNAFRTPVRAIENNLRIVQSDFWDDYTRYMLLIV